MECRQDVMSFILAWSGVEKSYHMNCRQEMRLDGVKIWYELDCCEDEHLNELDSRVDAT